MPKPTGYVLLHAPRFNRGSALTEQGGDAHGLEGLIPAWPITLEMQTAPAYPPQNGILKAFLHATGPTVFDYEAASVPRPDDIAALIAPKASP
jgi:hypothetical protein